MSRPTVEVDDIMQAQGNRFLDHTRQRLGYQQLKVLSAIAAAAPRHWAIMSMSAPAADTRPSRIIPAATGTAPSARLKRANGGSTRGRRSCWRCATSMSCSLSPTS